MEPADEELLGLMPQQLRDDLATVSRMAAHGAGPDVTPGLFEASLTAGALQFVRAVLAAEAEGPAVPEGREPASVVGEPSDENCWQWYTYCPEEGIELYSSREQAQSAAQSIMGSYAVAAHSDGWHEDMELASWGMLVPIERAQAVERKTVELDDEFDEWVKYELKTPRWGHQPAPPTEGEVADLIAWLGDEADQYDCIQQSAETSHKLRRAAYLLAHHHPAPPTEGEVGELIERLNLISVGMDAIGHESDSWFVAHAATLLKRRHPTPVPVSERLPEPEDCDAEERCWLLAPRWILPPSELTHWLPATALPLPAAEVQP